MISNKEFIQKKFNLYICHKNIKKKSLKTYTFPIKLKLFNNLTYLLINHKHFQSFYIINYYIKLDLNLILY